MQEELRARTELEFSKTWTECPHSGVVRTAYSLSFCVEFACSRCVCVFFVLLCFIFHQRLQLRLSPKTALRLIVGSKLPLVESERADGLAPF